MPSQYKEARVCKCGFSTIWMPSWSNHKKSCKLIKDEHSASERERIASLERQLHAKDEHYQKELQDNRQHYQKELAVKDRQLADQAEEIKMLIKRPRTVNNNNRYVVEQHINVFGQESLEHITPEQIQGLLSDPESAVARLVKLKHRKEPRNANIRCPNMNRAIYQVVVRDGEEKEWENRAKGDVLEKLYDDTSCMLEAEADEDDHTPFLDHQDKVKASMSGEDGGRCYKDQLDKIHHMIIQ